MMPTLFVLQIKATQTFDATPQGRVMSRWPRVEAQIEQLIANKNP